MKKSVVVLLLILGTAAFAALRMPVYEELTTTSSG